VTYIIIVTPLEAL